MVKFSFIYDSRNEEEKFYKFKYNVVSLAYIITFSFPQNNGKSFIYIRNNSRPKMDLCGTPVFTFQS